MEYLFKAQLIKSPMSTRITILLLLLSPSLAFSQTTSTTDNNSAAVTDSAAYFLQKGLQEKEKGRRMESLKNFEKAEKYDANNKAIVTELASAYYDLRRYAQAIISYKKLVELGEGSAAI